MTKPSSRANRNRMTTMAPSLPRGASARDLQRRLERAGDLPPAREQRGPERVVVRIDPRTHLPAAAPPRTLLGEGDQMIEERSAGRRVRACGVEHGGKSAAAQRSKICHGHDADELAARPLRHVNVLIETDERAAIEAGTALRAALEQQRVHAIEVAATAAPQPHVRSRELPYGSVQRRS